MKVAPSQQRRMMEEEPIKLRIDMEVWVKQDGLRGRCIQISPKNAMKKRR